MVNSTANQPFRSESQLTCVGYARSSQLTSGIGTTGVRSTAETVFAARQELLAALQQHKQAAAAVQAALAQAARSQHCPASPSSQQHEGSHADTACPMEEDEVVNATYAAEMALSADACSSQQHGGGGASTAHPMQEGEAGCAAGSRAETQLHSTQDSEEQGRSLRKKKRRDESECVEGIAQLNAVICHLTTDHCVHSICHRPATLCHRDSDCAHMQ